MSAGEPKRRALTLVEALEIGRRPVDDGAPRLNVFLACGFTPLHVQTLLTAQLRLSRPDHDVHVATGRFGDLIGNIERLQASSFDSVVAVIEWADLDTRLGIRSLGGWRAEMMPKILDGVNQAVERVRHCIVQAARRVPITVSMPTLPLPPLSWTSPNQASAFEVQLRESLTVLEAALCKESRIRIVSAQSLAEISPLSERFDIKSEIVTGFPYSLSHASALASHLAALSQSSSPKKGLITDLDDTLWAGIVGDDGVDGISWDLEHRTHMHGVYQQFVASLASAGVLVGVASKNDAAVVDQAFERSDLLLTRADIFPMEVHWSPKSESIRRILSTWNVGADSIVFVDDSPMEVAEVKAALPDVECLVFPKNDYQGIWNLLQHLRGRFGKPILTEEDTLRLNSIRESSAWRDAGQGQGASSDDFLRAADGCITFGYGASHGDARAFELVNKTNQFNLNGKRVTEAEWLQSLADPAGVVVGVSYQDKYGRLGKVAVLLGRTEENQLHVTSWVMSCRAFSRRIEHHMLKYLFDKLHVTEVVFGYEGTAKNGPLKEFLTELLGEATPGARLSRASFLANSPALLHQVIESSVE